MVLHLMHQLTCWEGDDQPPRVEHICSCFTYAADLRSLMAQAVRYHGANGEYYVAKTFAVCLSDASCLAARTPSQYPMKDLTYESNR
jgi:hypothetical protein